MWNVTRMPNRIKTPYCIPKFRITNKKYFDVKIVRSKYVLLFILDFRFNEMSLFGLLFFFKTSTRNCS